MYRRILRTRDSEQESRGQTREVWVKDVDWNDQRGCLYCSTAPISHDNLMKSFDVVQMQHNTPARIFL